MGGKDWKVQGSDLNSREAYFEIINAQTKWQENVKYILTIQRLRISGFLLKDIYVPSEDQIGQQVLNHGYYTVAFTVYVSTRLSSYSSRDSLASALLNFDEYTVRDDQGNY